MKQHRHPNKKCFHCGTQLPNGVARQERRHYESYHCSDCGSTIIERVVSTNGEPARSIRSTPIPSGRLLLSDETQWDTIEIWWTNISTVAAIHGRVVYGDAALMDFAKEIVSIYDDTS